MTICRAKFQVHSVKHALQSDGSIAHVEVKLGAVCDSSESNKSWSKWTPYGQMEMHVTNPDLFDKFKPGAYVFLDVSAAQA